MLDDQGAERVFVDIEVDTANADPNLIEDAIPFHNHNHLTAEEIDYVADVLERALPEAQ